MAKNYSGKLKIGFTLIEILIAIAIIALLGAAFLATGGMKAQLAKARDGKRKSDLKKMQNILEDYYNDHNRYPQTDEFFCDAPFSPYIGLIPCDPSGESYLYLSCESGQAFLIFTNLDHQADPAIEEGDCPAGCSVGSFGVYNFGVASANRSLSDTSDCGPGL